MNGKITNLKSRRKQWNFCISG